MALLLGPFAGVCHGVWPAEACIVERLKERHEIIGEVRGRGLMQAIFEGY